MFFMRRECRKFRFYGKIIKGWEKLDINIEF